MYPTFNLNIIFIVSGTQVLEWDLNKWVLADKQGSTKAESEADNKRFINRKSKWQIWRDERCLRADENTTHDWRIDWWVIFLDPA